MTPVPLRWEMTPWLESLEPWHRSMLLQLLPFPASLRPVADPNPMPRFHLRSTAP